MHPLIMIGRTLVVIGTLAILVASVVCFIEVESIIVTGPMIAFIGSVLMILAGLRRAGWAFLLGLSMPAVSLFVFLLIFLLKWGPRDAQQPVSAIGALYCFTTLCLAYPAYKHWPRRYQPWQCSGCGYALVGLSGTQCPECGVPFDPSKVPAELPRGAKLD